MLTQLAAVHDSIAAADTAVIGVAPAAGFQARYLIEESIPFSLYIDRKGLVGKRIGIGRQSLAHFVFSLPAWWRYLKAFFSGQWQRRITGHYSNLPGICVVEASGEVAYMYRGKGLGDYPPIDEVLTALGSLGGRPLSTGRRMWETMPEMAHRTASNRVLVVIGAFVVLLVVVAVVFAIQPPTEFAPDTPEGTAQGYFRAVNDGDQDLAETFMTDELRSECEWDWWFYGNNESARVVITDTKIEGDSAEVRVSITVSYGDDPFGGSSYDSIQIMEMEHSGDRWLISAPVWPVDRYACGKVEG